MTLFQKLVVILATVFLAIMIYDRVRGERHARDTQNAIKEKEMWDAYRRCIDSLPYPAGANDEERKAWLRARNGCLVNLGMPIQEQGK